MLYLRCLSFLSYLHTAAATEIGAWVNDRRDSRAERTQFYARLVTLNDDSRYTSFALQTVSPLPRKMFSTCRVHLCICNLFTFYY